VQRHHEELGVVALGVVSCASVERLSLTILRTDRGHNGIELRHKFGARVTRCNVATSAPIADSFNKPCVGEMV